VGAFHRHPVLQAARSLGVDIDSVCGGRGICGRCQVLVSEGEFPKHGLTSKVEHLSPVGKVEQEYCVTQPLADGRRLSCSAQVLGDVVIDVPSSSQVHKQVVRKEAEAHDVELDPLIRLHYVEVQQPDMHDPSGDLRRLEDALEFEWRLTELACDVIVVQQLQKALRAGDWKVTVAVHAGKQIVAVWPGFKEKVFGLAVDIGSTTIAGAPVQPGIGRSGGIGWPDESANPLRRRFDEPRVLRDDESGRRQGNDRRRARGTQHAGCRGRGAGRHHTAGHSGSHLCGQPHHAPPAAGH